MFLKGVNDIYCSRMSYISLRWCKAKWGRTWLFSSDGPHFAAHTSQLQVVCVIRQTQVLPVAWYPQETQPARQGWRSKFMLWDKAIAEGWEQQSVWPSGRRLSLVLFPSSFITVLSLSEPHSQLERARPAVRGCGPGTPATSDKINIRIRGPFWLLLLDVFQSLCSPSFLPC